MHSMAELIRRREQQVRRHGGRASHARQWAGHLDGFEGAVRRYFSTLADAGCSESVVQCPCPCDICPCGVKERMGDQSGVRGGSQRKLSRISKITRIVWFRKLSVRHLWPFWTLLILSSPTESAQYLHSSHHVLCEYPASPIPINLASTPKPVVRPAALIVPRAQLDRNHNLPEAAQILLARDIDHGRPTRRRSKETGILHRLYHRRFDGVPRVRPSDTVRSQLYAR